MKKELKNIIFDTVINLRELFVKLIDTNENNNRKITGLSKMVENTKEVRGVGKRGKTNNIADSSSAVERNTLPNREEGGVAKRWEGQTVLRGGRGEDSTESMQANRDFLGKPNGRYNKRNVKNTNKPG